RSPPPGSTITPRPIALSPGRPTGTTRRRLRSSRRPRPPSPSQPSSQRRYQPRAISASPASTRGVRPPPPSPLVPTLSPTGSAIAVAVHHSANDEAAAAVTRPTCPLLKGGDYAPVHPGAHPHRDRAPRAAGIRLRPAVAAGLGNRPANA